MILNLNESLIQELNLMGNRVDELKADNFIFQLKKKDFQQLSNIQIDFDEVYNTELINRLKELIIEISMKPGMRSPF